MNVVRQLRNTITHLEAELDRKDQNYNKYKKEYEDIISSLQDENRRLKTLFEADSSINRPEETSPFQSQSCANKKQSALAECPDYAELLHENTFLRNQISQLSSTYQKQIDQIVFYFDKIKQQNKRLLPAQSHYAGQLIYLEKSYQSLIKDNEKEREIYKAKLLECSQLLQAYQQKITAQEQEIQSLKSSMNELREQMKILCRISF